MRNFGFLLENNAANGFVTFAMIGVMILVFYFFIIRPQKKQEQKDSEMRSSLAVGDEVTTIGGIIGKVISIKEETFVLETTRDKTKIRFLKGAIRSIDVKAADIAATVAADNSAEEANADKNSK
ncbi:MAG: preprotein translocase subunit YajC [Ruminococcaceae bacterium]|nr:preprotein translocase subunit YajC [Oscillospiraceae bacterium]